MKLNKKSYGAIICTLLFFLTLSIGLKAQHKQTTEKLIANASEFIVTPQDIDLLEAEEEGEAYPCNDLYETWKNKDVNPYKVEIKNLDDSVKIDCSEYHHPIEGAITSNFGPRRSRFHYGIDLRVNVGDDIYAAFEGKVRVTSYDRYGYGYYVIIRHNNGLETLYGHLSQIKVVPNQNVKAGDVIGLAGNTGRSTGPHLHFETRYLGNAINPKNIIDFTNYVPYNDTYLICKKTSFKEIIDYKKAKYCTVKSGDTLSGIARRYGTTVDRLCKLNRISRNSILRPKQRIRYS